MTADTALIVVGVGVGIGGTALIIHAINARSWRTTTPRIRVTGVIALTINIIIIILLTSTADAAITTVMSILTIGIVLTRISAFIDARAPLATRINASGARVGCTVTLIIVHALGVTNWRGGRTKTIHAICAAPTICSAITVLVVIAWITVLLQCSKKALLTMMALLLHLFSAFQINGMYFTKRIIHQKGRKKDKEVNRFHYHHG